MSARLPLPLIIGNHGDYGFVRRSPADGACGYSGIYPCTHWGLDLAAAEGTPVASPVDGNVIYSVGEIPPFAGFGPYIVVIEDSDASEPYRYHLLAHLNKRLTFGDNWAGGTSPWPTRIRKPVRAGEVVGYVSNRNHSHWQAQSLEYQRGGKVWSQITTHPRLWAERRGAIWTAPKTLGITGAAVAALGYLTLKKG